jgi:glycosyltransferase involved in cell wall biosynthesis
VIPVRNRPVAVRRAIESVLAQTFQDFEIIVVDDGSTDDTASAVAMFTDPRVRLIRHDRTRGGSAARNTGIDAGTAPYIAFLDSDDEWLPTKLQRQLELFEGSSDDLGLVYAGTQRVYADGSCDTYIPSRHKDIVRVSLTANVIGDTSVGMVRRIVLNVTGTFDESLPASQEMDLWLRICEHFRVDFVPEALARVSKGDDSGRITANIAATTRGRELFRRKHRKKMTQHGVLHLHLRESGWWYLRAARDAVQARRCYFEAAAAKPAAPMTYMLLAMTYMPMSWLDRTANWKHFTTRLLRLAGRRSRPTGLNLA